MVVFDVNWLALIVAAVADMIIGSLWYSPVLFGDRWMKAMGKRKEDLGDPAGAMTVAIPSALVSAFVLALVLASLGVDSLLAGAGVGLLLWLGFTLPPVALKHAFEGDSRTVAVLFLAYRLVALLIAGAIIGAWS